ncbi:MAG: hypothetical protein Q8R92_14920, partial [Deltaproteobacteria bacterium]|nr:hypothetical protein [Deltaproteobacteria bacterium]
RLWWLSAMCMLALGAVPGCNESGVVAESPPPAPTVKSPDRVESGSRRVSSYYAPGNPYVLQSIDELLARRDVATIVGNFERSGFELVRAECLVLEERGPEGEARVTVLTLAPLMPGVSETVLIACVEQNGEIVIAPAAFRGSPGEHPDDFLQMGENLWVSRSPLGPALAAADVAQVDDEFWIRILNCINVSVPAAAGACLVTCWFTLGEYPICVISCVAAQSAAVVIRCYIQVATTMPIKPKIPKQD